MRKLNEEEIEEYRSNIEKISSLLEQNEKLIRQAGYNPPVVNFTIEKESRIKMPQGYIRRSGEFWKHRAILIDIAKSVLRLVSVVRTLLKKIDVT